MEFFFLMTTRPRGMEPGRVFFFLIGYRCSGMMHNIFLLFCVEQIRDIKEIPYALYVM